MNDLSDSSNLPTIPPSEPPQPSPIPVTEVPAPATTSPHIVTIIVIAMAMLALTGILSAFWLVLNHADAASIALFSVFGSTALGSLSGMLNNTRTQK